MKAKYNILIVAAATAVYILAKMYVAHTPDPSDDAIPDMVKDKILKVVDF